MAYFHLWPTLGEGCFFTAHLRAAWIQDLLKESAPKLRTDRTLAIVGMGVSEGVMRKKVIDLIWCILFAWDDHTKSGASYLSKKNRGCARCMLPHLIPHLNPPLHLKICLLIIGLFQMPRLIFHANWALLNEWRTSSFDFFFHLCLKIS